MIDFYRYGKRPPTPPDACCITDVGRAGESRGKIPEIEFQFDCRGNLHQPSCNPGCNNCGRRRWLLAVDSAIGCEETAILIDDSPDTLGHDPNAALVIAQRKRRQYEDPHNGKGEITEIGYIGQGMRDQWTAFPIDPEAARKLAAMLNAWADHAQEGGYCAF